MSKRCTFTCILALAGITGVFSAAQSRHTANLAFLSAIHPRALVGIRPHHRQYFAANRLSEVARGNLAPSANSNCSIPARCVASLAIPMTFEPNVGQFDPRVKFVGRGAGMTLLLTRKGIDVEVANRGLAGASGRIRTVRMSVGWAARLNESAAKTRFDRSRLAWHGAGRVKTVSNYFLGRNREAWRTSVPHFARAVAASSPEERVIEDVYGNNDGVEFDLRLAPGTDASKLRLRFAGTTRVQLSGGDLLLFANHRALRVKIPRVYQQLPGANRKIVPGRYVMEADGSVGLQLGPYDTRAAVVIDPSISVAYATFLGGAGAETAGNIAMDAAGKIYVGGSTTSATTFPETSAAGIGTVVSSSALFVAKIDPTINGANSLLYLTFLGGSGVQAGGIIAVDGAGDVAITGTTTSTDFPVTGSSQATNGLTSGDGNDVVVSEIDPTGSKLDFSSYFGGSGKQSENGAGGIAIDGAGDVYIATDTNTTAVDPASADLPVTSGAYQAAWDAQASDGFLAVFAPPAQPGNAPTLTYCTYLGTNSTGPVIIGGIAVDSLGNAYVAGSTSNASIAFPAQNAFQSAYGGGTSDGFVMKISPGGQGAGDLAFATLIGGSGVDEALGIALDSGVAPRVYVTGETQSADFPVNGANAPYQNKLRANPLTSGSSNAFLTVIAQDAVSSATSLTYSTYLGGSGADAGLSLAVAAPDSVYVAGQTDSADFPWHDNLQPFNGQVDAFVAKFDPTASGAPSFLYATPLAGTSPPGQTVGAAATGVASNGSGQLYLTGQTSAADFPTAITTQSAANGFQQTCASCQAASASADAFVVAIDESTTQGPSVYFNASSVTFAASSIGSPNLAQLAAVLNGGEQTLTISDMQILGPNASDFSLQGQGPCLGIAIAPGSSPRCSFEVNFTASISGPETAFVAVSDNAPGSPQLLELRGAGQGPHAMIVPLSVNFGSQPLNTVSNGQAITIKNSGNQSLTLARESGPGTAQFQLQGGSC
jgi:Beta-propeller repeat